MRARVLTSTVVTLALLLGGLLFAAHRFVEDTVFEQYLQTQELTTQMSARVFEDFIASALKQLEATARDPEVIWLSEEGRLKLQGLQSSMGGLVGSVIRLDSDMRVVYVYPPDRQLMGRPLTANPWFSEFARTRRQVAGEPVATEHGYRALPLIQPVFARGAFDGGLAALLRVDQLDRMFWRQLQRIGMEGGVAALVNQQGRVFWSQGVLAEGTILTPEEPGARQCRLLVEALGRSRLALPTSMRTRVPTKPGHWIVAVASVEVSGNQWYLLTGTPDDALVAAINTYRGIVLASGALVVLFGVLLGLNMVSRRRHLLATQERARLADPFEASLQARTEELARAKAELETYARSLEEQVRQHTQKLRESEELYRQLVDNVSTIIFLLDAGKLDYANPAFNRSLGYAEDDSSLVGTEFISLVSVDSRPALLEALAELARGSTTADLLGLTLQARNKQLRIWDGSVKRLARWPHETFLGFFRDVTEQKQIEHQVLQVQKLESVGCLAGGIAHDFNNILAGIFGNLALLRASVGTAGVQEESKKLFDTIETAARRAADLTKKLLIFSRKEGEDRKAVDLKQSIGEVSALMRTSLPANVTYTTSVSDEELKVLGNATEIQQVLLNLCMNAVEAMPEGGALQVIATRVRAGTDAHFPPGLPPDAELARIRVTDEGTGINPRFKDKIFEPFFTTKEPGKGTGLGLSIAYHIVNKHGGTIEVDSDWGRGSVFSVYLPLADAGADILQPAPEYEYPDFSRAKPILVVDDEEMITLPLQQFFEKHGLKVYIAADGVYAIEVFKQRQHEIGLVLLDQRMPRLSGSEAYSIIRQLNPSTVGVLMTGFGEDISNVDYFRMGFAEVLQKPFTFEDLSRVFERYLL